MYWSSLANPVRRARSSPNDLSPCSSTNSSKTSSIGRLRLTNYLSAPDVVGVQERLALRNYLDELRGTGERTGGPAALDNTDRKRFADSLDRLLSKIAR